MEDLGEKDSDQAYAVPFRINLGRPEFCLISRGINGRWDFPRCLVSSGEPLNILALRRALLQSGFECEIASNEPLDAFFPALVNEAKQIKAFLVRVENEFEIDSAGQPYRRRWCFPEEAKLRIRRKPVRRLVDLAVRQLNGQSAD